jgi:protein-L-isoaspartate(D-aspartate) O-methyltransferase
VLEIGAGTGYNAALLAHLVGPTGAVVSLDIDPEVVERARAALAAAGFAQVRVVHRDGADGYPSAAPYDRIIATAGVWDLAPAWLDQLAPGGRIVVPLDLRGAQLSVAFEREGGHWVSRSQVPCGFMRLRGQFAGHGRIHVLDRSTGLRLAVPDDRDVDLDGVTAALAGPALVRQTEVSGLGRDDGDGLVLWLALTEPRSCSLSDERHGAAALEPAMVASPEFRATPGVLDTDSIALLGLRAAGAAFVVDSHGYGPAGDRLATDLTAHAAAWDAAGRPQAERMRITAYPAGGPDPDHGMVLAKTHTRLVIAFQP